jgi:dihydrofolate reductase
VVAIAQNGVIGRDNALPWKLPEDLKHFKAVTLGKPVLMGRRTFESIGRPLPGRINLVLTRNPHWHATGAVVVRSPAEALEAAGSASELHVIGGSDVFKLLLPAAERIHLTRVHAQIAGDTVFPEIDWARWIELETRRYAADERNAYDLSFVTLERAPAASR